MDKVTTKTKAFNRKVNSRKRAIKKMRELVEKSKTEDLSEIHCDADEILCKALRRHGEYTLIKLYYEVGKWYA